MRTGDSRTVTNGRTWLLALGLMFGLAGIGYAQAPNIRITQLGMRDVRTPQFRDTSNTMAVSRYQWAQFVVRYESSGGRDGWLDNVQLNWCVLMMPRSGRPMLFKENVVYENVPQGTHFAVVYLPPRLVQRYTGHPQPEQQNFAIYVEIHVDGRPMARMSQTRLRIPNNWFNAGPPNVNLIQGDLLPRTKTPFANMDWDFYDQIKSTSP